MKLLVAQAEGGKRIYVAQDPHPASVKVQRAAERAAKAADLETASLKAKRPA